MTTETNKDTGKAVKVTMDENSKSEKNEVWTVMEDHPEGWMMVHGHVRAFASRSDEVVAAAVETWGENVAVMGPTGNMVHGSVDFQGTPQDERRVASPVDWKEVSRKENESGKRNAFDIG